jgi:hypothetical protein
MSFTSACRHQAVGSLSFTFLGNNGRFELSWAFSFHIFFLAPKEQLCIAV